MIKQSRQSIISQNSSQKAHMEFINSNYDPDIASKFLNKQQQFEIWYLGVSKDMSEIIKKEGLKPQKDKQFGTGYFLTKKSYALQYSQFLEQGYYDKTTELENPQYVKQQIKNQQDNPNLESNNPGTIIQVLVGYTKDKIIKQETFQGQQWQKEGYDLFRIQKSDYSDKEGIFVPNSSQMVILQLTSNKAKNIHSNIQLPQEIQNLLNPKLKNYQFQYTPQSDVNQHSFKKENNSNQQNMDVMQSFFEKYDFYQIGYLGTSQQESQNIKQQGLKYQKKGSQGRGLYFSDIDKAQYNSFYRQKGIQDDITDISEESQQMSVLQQQSNVKVCPRSKDDIEEETSEGVVVQVIIGYQNEKITKHEENYQNPQWIQEGNDFHVVEKTPYSDRPEFVVKNQDQVMILTYNQQPESQHQPTCLSEEVFLFIKNKTNNRVNLINPIEAMISYTENLLKDMIDRMIYGIPSTNQMFGLISGDCIMFIIDTSGSMDQTFTNDQDQEVSRLESAKNNLLQCISRLQESQFFNIKSFNSGTDTWQPRAVKATLQNIQLAVQWICTLNVKGCTNISLPIEETFTNEQDVDVIYILSDGEANEGIKNPIEIKKKVKSWNVQRPLPIIINTISIFHNLEQDYENSVQRYLYGISRATGGTYRQNS